MRQTSIGCPHCDSTHVFFLRDAERHLRQCPTCDGWFVLSGPPGAGGESGPEPLGDPAECPVVGCAETLQSGDLPMHIIAEHDGALD